MQIVKVFDAGLSFGFRTEAIDLGFELFLGVQLDRLCLESIRCFLSGPWRAGQEASLVTSGFSDSDTVDCL